MLSVLNYYLCILYIQYFLILFLYMFKCQFQSQYLFFKPFHAFDVCFTTFFVYYYLRVFHIRAAFTSFKYMSFIHCANSSLSQLSMQNFLISFENKFIFLYILFLLFLLSFLRFLQSLILSIFSMFLVYIYLTL